jgi:hypothetical protein
MKAGMMASCYYVISVIHLRIPTVSVWGGKYPKATGTVMIAGLLLLDPQVPKLKILCLINGIQATTYLIDHHPS